MPGIIPQMYQLHLISIRFTLPYKLPFRLEWTSQGQKDVPTSQIYKLSGLKAVADETLILNLPQDIFNSTLQLYAIPSKPAQPRLIGSLQVNLKEVRLGSYSREKEYELSGIGRNIFLSFELIHVTTVPSLLDETVKKQSTEQECDKSGMFEKVEILKRQLICAMDNLSEATKQNDYLVGKLNVKQEENAQQALKIQELQKINESLKDNNKELAKVANSKKDSEINQRIITGKLAELKMINTQLQLKVTCMEDELSNSQKQKDSIRNEYESKLAAQNNSISKKYSEQIQKLLKSIQLTIKQRNKLAFELNQQKRSIQLLQSQIQRAKQEKSEQITQREWEQLRHEYSQWKTKQQELTVRFQEELWRFQEREEVLKQHLDELEQQISEYCQESEAKQKQEVRLREQVEHLKVEVESLMIYKAHYERLVAIKFTRNGNAQSGGQSEDKSILLDLLGKTTKKLLTLQEQNKFNMQSFMKANADGEQMEEMREENQLLRDKIKGLLEENKMLISNNSRLGKEINSLTREVIKLKDQQRWNQLTHKIQPSQSSHLLFTFKGASQKPLDSILGQIKEILKNRETQVEKLTQINLKSNAETLYQSILDKINGVQRDMSYCKMKVIHHSTFEKIPTYTQIFNNCLQGLESALADVALLMK